MYRISFEQPCSKSITATYTIFNREHAGVTPVNTCEFCRKQKIFTELIVRMADRQTDVINTFQISLQNVDFISSLCMSKLCKFYP
jgi:hypothetical protein